MLAQYLKRGSHNAFFYGLNSAFARGISFVFLPYFLSQLTLIEFGIWDFYQMFFSMSSMLLTSCAATGMIRFFLLYKDDAHKQQQAIGNAFLMTLLGALFFPPCAILFLRALYPAVLQSDYALITIVNISLFALFSMVLAFMRMKEKLVWYTVLFCGQNLLATGLTVFFVSRHYGIQSFFYASGISFAFFIPLFFILFGRVRAFSFSIFKEQMNYSMPLLAYSFIYMGFYSLDRMFIKYSNGFEALGTYGLLGRFGALYQFFSIALIDAWPIILFNAQKEKEGDRLISRLVAYFLLVLTTGGLVAVVASSYAIQLFLASKYWDITSLLALYFMPLVFLEVARVMHVGFSLSTKTFLSPIMVLIGLGIQTFFLWLCSGYDLGVVMLANTLSFFMYGAITLFFSKKSYRGDVIPVARVSKIGSAFIIYSFILHEFLATQYNLAQVGILLSWPLALWITGIIEADEKKWLWQQAKEKIKNYFRNEVNLQLSSKNILYLRTDINFEEVKAGGSVAHTLGVINGFKAVGYNVLCASSSMQSLLRDLELPFFKKLKIYPVFTFLRWKLGHLRWRLDCFFANIFFTLQLVKVIKQHSIQYIYQRYSLLNCVGLILSRLKDIPLVLEYNGSEVWVFNAWSEHRWFKLTWLAKSIENLNIQYADFIVVVSQAIKDELVGRGVDSEKILVNPNGVDPVLFNPEILNDVQLHIRQELAIQNKFVFGFVGTFSYWHGIEVLAHIIPLLAAKYPNVHFLLIGDGPLKNYIMQVINNAGAMQFATFTGLVPQYAARDYLAACDAFLCPTQPNKDGTRFFGSPTKMFEYMSMGRPIIASDLEQIGELMAPSLALTQLDEIPISNQFGILVKPESFDDFYHAACKLLGFNKLQIQKMGANARSKVTSSYTWEQHANNIKEFVMTRR